MSSLNLKRDLDFRHKWLNTDMTRRKFGMIHNAVDKISYYAVSPKMLADSIEWLTLTYRVNGVDLNKMTVATIAALVAAYVLGYKNALNKPESK